MLKHYINPDITHKWGLKQGAKRGTTPLFFFTNKDQIPKSQLERGCSPIFIPI